MKIPLNVLIKLICHDCASGISLTIYFGNDVELCETCKKKTDEWLLEAKKENL